MKLATETLSHCSTQLHYFDSKQNASTRKKNEQRPTLHIFFKQKSGEINKDQHYIYSSSESQEKSTNNNILSEGNAEGVALIIHIHGQGQEG